MPDNQVLACIGLISDTHFQERLFALPPNLSELWGAIDLILHAGDVGDLSVLDQLGQIAPVVAVHGNDEPEAAKRDLPEQQLLSVRGLRLLLWHSHYPDPVEEKANRKGAWGPKLDRIVARPREAGAVLLVYGHTHVPAISRHAGVTLFNPGALASGSFFTRQALPTVGRLRVLAGGAFEVEHVDIATGRVVEMPAPGPGEDFSLLAGRYHTSIVEPELVPLVAELARIPYEAVRPFVQAMIPLYRRCFDFGPILRLDMIEAIQSSDSICRSDREKCLAILERR
jgi:putative phosphoesterase